MHLNKTLVEFITDYLSSSTLELPVFHSVALKLRQKLAGSSYSIDEVMELIIEDQALASKILRVANSPFYAGLSKVTTIRDALVRLGAEEVANLAMLVSQQEFYRSDNDLFNNHMHTLWNHALGCAVGTKWLAIKTGFKNLAQEAFLAGLLHDIGKLFLLKVLDELNSTSQLSFNLTEPLIKEVLDSLHTKQGGTLMQKWNLPETYCRIVLDHHQEECMNDDPLTMLVRLSNLACRKAGVSVHHEPSIVLLSTREAQFLGTREIVLAELEITIEDSVGGMH